MGRYSANQREKDLLLQGGDWLSHGTNAERSATSSIGKLKGTAAKV